MGWCHPVAVAVEQHSGEEARLASAGAGVALGGVAGELSLSHIPQRLIDDRLMFAPPGSASSVRQLEGRYFRA